MFGRALTLLLLCEPVLGQQGDAPSRARSMEIADRIEHRRTSSDKGDARKAEQEVWDRLLQDGSMSMSMDTDAPTMAPAPALPCDLTAAEREEQLRALILGEFPDAPIDSGMTNEGRAFEFILNEDEFVVCPNDPVCPTKAINRFVAALFYFDTNGDEWVNCGAQSDECDPDGIVWGDDDEFETSDCFEGSANRWLSANDECTWCGLSCSDAEDIGPFIGVAPPPIDNCFLTDIRLEELNQSGEISPELGSLPELLTIQLENGAIEGNIPSTLGGLPNLAILDLNFQELTGDIPEALYGATRLIELDLNDNMITGSVSELIGNLQTLLFFDVGNNEMGQMLPSTFATLNVLAALGIYNNSFSGEMPTINSIFLESLLMENNQLEGDDLDWLQLNENPTTNEVSLQVLDVKRNLFGGTIPTRLGEQATNLTFASFFENDFVGTMPESVCNLTFDPLAVLEADCEDQSGPPEIECDCCTFCN